MDDLMAAAVTKRVEELRSNLAIELTDARPLPLKLKMVRESILSHRRALNSRRRDDIAMRPYTTARLEVLEAHRVALTDAFLAEQRGA